MLGKSTLLLVVAVGSVAAQGLAAARAQEGTGGALDPQQVEGVVDRAMAGLMKETWAPGAIVSVVQGDRILLAKGYGVADAPTGRPIDPERTLFRIGSVTKVLTAVAALRLAQAGRLDLDADANRYLRRVKIPDHHGWGPVTSRLLMTHRGGFETAIFHVAVPTDAQTPMRAEVAQRELGRIRPPSAPPLYDNLGYGVLGLVVADIDGTSYRQAMRDLVFGPLGMSAAVVGAPPNRVHDLSSAHMPGSDGAPHPIPQALIRDVAQGGGDISVSATDMARFMRGLLVPGPFLSERSLTEMGRVQETLNPRMPGLALGWTREMVAGRTALVKTGEINGFASAVMLFPDTGVGLFASFNGLNRAPPNPRLSALFHHTPSSPKTSPQQARTKLLATLAAAFTPGTTAARPVSPPAADELRPEALAGSYFRTDNSKSLLVRLLTTLSAMKVETTDKGLKSNRCAPFVRVGPMYYECRRADGTTARLGFARLPNGRILGGSSVTEPMPRQPWWRGAGLTVLPLLPLALLQILAAVRRRYETDPAPRRFFAVAGASGAAFLAALLLELEFGWSLAHSEGAYLAPWLWRALFPLATAGLLLNLAFVTRAAAWPSSRVGKALALATALGGAGLAALSVYWGLATLSF
jgi:CubicO group peptidase (beta-lactamase class C family)